MRIIVPNKTRLLTITHLKKKILNYEKLYECAIINKFEGEYKKLKAITNVRHWCSGSNSWLYICYCNIEVMSSIIGFGNKAQIQQERTITDIYRARISK